MHFIFPYYICYGDPRFFLRFIFWLWWVFVAARGLSLVAESGGYTLIAALGQPFAVASLVAEYGPDVPGLQ